MPRWLWLNHLPEGLHLTPEQYADVKRRVKEMGPQQRRFTPVSRRILVRVAPATALLIVGFLLWLVWLVRVRPAGGFGIAASVAGPLVFQALLWIAIAWSINRAIAPLVWRALNQAGFRVCEQCGYLLENLPLEIIRCPECGTPQSPPTASPGRRAATHGENPASR
jgi:hypothetical protein